MVTGLTISNVFSHYIPKAELPKVPKTQEAPELQPLEGELPCLCNNILLK